MVQFSTFLCPLVFSANWQLDSEVISHSGLISLAKLDVVFGKTIRGTWCVLVHLFMMLVIDVQCLSLLYNTLFSVVFVLWIFKIYARSRILQVNRTQAFPNGTIIFLISKYVLLTFVFWYKPGCQGHSKLRANEKLQLQGRDNFSSYFTHQLLWNFLLQKSLPLISYYWKSPGNISCMLWKKRHSQLPWGIFLSLALLLICLWLPLVMPSLKFLDSMKPHIGSPS